MNDLNQKAKEVIEFMSYDYSNFRKSSSSEIQPLFFLEEGRNYIKIFEKPVSGGLRVCGFIVKTPPKGLDNKTKEPFQVGDLLMAASWSAPAKNFARGNVFNDGWKTCVRWTGIL